MGTLFFLPDLDQSEDMLIDEIVKVIFKTWIIVHYYTWNLHFKIFLCSIPVEF